MAEPQISVIIPTFNRAHCLPKALDSALAQTFGDLEVIVIDDGSTDTTRDLFQGPYASCERVLYRRQDNQGVSVARNHAMELARGHFVAFLDSDDYWEPWKLELQMACFRRFPELVMVWSDMKAIAPDGAVAHERYLRRMYDAYRWFPGDSMFSESEPLESILPELATVTNGAFLKMGDIYSAMVMGSLVHTSTVVLRREVAEKVGRFNTAYRSGEDYDFHLRTCKFGKVGLMDLAAIQYQVGMDDRLTRSDMRLHSARNFLQVLEKTLSEDKDRITLSSRMKRRALSDAHEWIGQALLTEDKNGEARFHLVRSLLLNPTQPAVWRALLSASMPRQAKHAARTLFRRPGIDRRSSNRRQ